MGRAYRRSGRDLKFKKMGGGDLKGNLMTVSTVMTQHGKSMINRNSQIYSLIQIYLIRYN